MRWAADNVQLVRRPGVQILGALLGTADPLYAIRAIFGKRQARFAPTRRRRVTRLRR